MNIISRPLYLLYLLSLSSLFFFENHFKNTLFHKIYAQALTTLMLSELIAASLCTYGCIYSIVYKNTGFIFYGLLKLQTSIIYDTHNLRYR